MMPANVLNLGGKFIVFDLRFRFDNFVYSSLRKYTKNCRKKWAYNLGI